MHLNHLGNSTFVYSNVTLCCLYDPKQLYFLDVLYIIQGNSLCEIDINVSAIYLQFKHVNEHIKMAIRAI